METTLLEIMSQIDKYHYMYGDLVIAHDDNEKFKRVHRECAEQRDRIRDLIKLYQHQTVIKELKTAINTLDD